MGTSTGRDLHIDQNLTRIAIDFRPQNMVVDMIAPIVPVVKATDIYPVFSRKEAWALESTLRSPGTEAKKVTRSVSSEGYSVKNYALGMDITIEDRANIDAAYEAKMFGNGAMYLKGKLMMDWHNRVISKVSSASNVSTGFTVNSAWNGLGAGAGDPISQLMQVSEQLHATTGQKPNSIMFGWRAWAYLRRNYHVRSMINGVNNGGGFVTRQQVQNLLEIDRFLVDEAFFNTANEAQAEALSSPFADKVLVYYAPPSPSRDDPSFMYSFRQNVPGVPYDMAAERHPYDSRKKIETIEVGYYQDEKITGSDYGALLLATNVATGTGLV